MLSEWIAQQLPRSSVSRLQTEWLLSKSGVQTILKSTQFTVFLANPMQLLTQVRHTKITILGYVGLHIKLSVQLTFFHIAEIRTALSDTISGSAINLQGKQWVLVMLQPFQCYILMQIWKRALSRNIGSSNWDKKAIRLAFEIQ